jgi:hypothetical protein
LIIFTAYLLRITVIITVNLLLAKFLAKGSKMWRMTVAGDTEPERLPRRCEKLLNMIEWWELLVVPPEEVEQVSRFKSLTVEQSQLLVSTTKAPGNIPKAWRFRLAWKRCPAWFPLPCNWRWG